MPDSHPLARDRRIVLWLLLGLMLLFAGLYVAAYLIAGDRVARGTTIAGIAVGGKTQEGAQRALEDFVSSQQEITLTADGGRVQVTPEQAGLAVDVEASVDQVAIGRSWDPRDLWEFFTGGSSYDAVEEVDEDRLAEAIAALGERVSRPPREGAVRFTGDGAARPVYPEAGQSIDSVNGTRLVLDAYPEDVDDPVEIPVVEDEPKLTEAEVSRAMKEFANPAMSAPVVFRITGQRVVLEPEQFASALSLERVGDRLEPRLDETRLLAAVEPVMRSVAVEPQDASVEIVDGAPHVVQGRSGITFDQDAITQAFLDLVVGEGAARELRVPTRIETPEYTAAEMRGLGITEKVSEFATYFPYAEYRNVNIGRAAELINGTILEPGDVFSLNRVVGERTVANGFVKGFVISDGVFRQDLGGGVSQVATTTFNAAFFAGLEDIEHKPHSFYIDRYPVGREATVAWPTVDLRFRNDTPHGVLVQAWRDLSTPSTQGAMHVRMWSTKTWDIKAGTSARYNFTSPGTRHLPPAGCEPNTGYGGFDIDVYRYFYRPGSDRRVRKETMHTHYTPSDTVICDG